MTMRVCLRNASDKLNFQISNPQIRLFCCLETHKPIIGAKPEEVGSAFFLRGGAMSHLGGGNDLSVEDSANEPMVL